MEHAAASTPLLADSETSSSGQLKPTYSECRLQDKCFLSDGAAKSSEDYQKVQRKLVTACVLCFIFMAVEVVGGYIAKSVAIMSDAAHMLSDVSAFLVSIFATWAATQSSSWHYSFGYHRAEILGALISVLTIWAVTGALVFEAVHRVINPVQVDGKLMFIIACAGVLFNILIGLTLGVHAHLGHSHDHDHGHDHGHHSHHDHGHDHQANAHPNREQDYSNPQTREAKHGHHHRHHHNHSSDGNGVSCNGHGFEHSCNSSSDSSHSCDSRHDHKQNDEQGNQQTQLSAHAPSFQSAATAFAQDSVVIDVPAGTTLDSSCSQEQAGVDTCTSLKESGRESEVHKELPVSAIPAAKAMGRTHADGHDHGHVGHTCGGHSHGSINLRSAVLHVIGDLLQSIGVAVAGGLIWLNQDDPRWHLADPICTFVFSIVVLLTTKSVLKDIIHVLMERTPGHINIPAMSEAMMNMDGVVDVHDLHIWNISTGTKPLLTAHVHIAADADPMATLQQLEEYVRRLGIDHSTIQICNVQRSPSSHLSDAEAEK